MLALGGAEPQGLRPGERGQRRLGRHGLGDLVGGGDRAHDAERHGLVGQRIDQDEGAELAVFLIGRRHHRPVEAEGDLADLVHQENVGRAGFEGVDVDGVVEAAHRGGRRRGGEARHVATAGNQRPVGHPEDVGGHGLLGRDRVGRPDEDIAARDIDLVGKGQGDRLAGFGAGDFAVGTPDRLDGGGAAAGHDGDRVAGGNAPADDGAGKAAEVEIGTVDPLHRQAERRRAGVEGLRRCRLQALQQRLAVIPGHVRRRGGDVVAILGRQRHIGDVGEAELRQDRLVVAPDRLVAFLAEVDEVHLVDGDHDALDADERGDEGVPPRLRQDALARIDEDDGELGLRGAGRHVAGVLLVARRVGDDEGAVAGREIAIGDIDGDALLALGRQAVDQQREVEILAGRAELAGITLQRVHLVVEDRIGLEEQAADQGRLAVVHRAAGDEAQEGFGRRQHRLHGGLRIDHGHIAIVGRGAREAFVLGDHGGIGMAGEGGVDRILAGAFLHGDGHVRNSLPASSLPSRRRNPGR